MKYFVLLTLLSGVVLPQAARADLVFYVADGDDAREDHLVKYDSSQPGPDKTSSMLMRDASNSIYNYPSDFVSVGGVVYGADRSRSNLYTVDLSTAIVTAIGSTGVGSMSGMAWAPGLGKVYGSAENTNNIYSVNTSTGQWTFDYGNSLLSGVTGLAYGNNLLYAFSKTSGKLISVDPSLNNNNPNKTVELVQLAQPNGAGGHFEELEFFNGQLYGAWYTFGTNTTTEAVQLKMIDINTGSTTSIGNLVEDAVGHALLMVSVTSVPEPSMIPIFLALTGLAVGRRRIVDWFRGSTSGN